MQDEFKTKRELIRELQDLRRRFEDLQAPSNSEIDPSFTEFKLSEKKLKESEARFRQLFNHMGNGAAVFDVLPGGGDLVFRDLNRSGEKIINLRKKSILGRSLLDVFPALEDPGILESLLRVWKTGKPERHPFSFRDREEQDRWLERYIFKLPSGEVVDIFDDVSDQKLAEQALLYSEARYRAVVEDQTELICRFSEDGTLTFVNEAYCRYFQESREELLGNKFWYHLPETDHPKLKKHLARLTPDNPVAIIQHRIVAPTGEMQWLRWTDRAIFDDQSRLLEYQGVGLDVTMARHAEMLTKTHARKIDLLNQIIGWSNKAPDLKALLKKFLDSTLRLMHFQGGAIYLVNETGKTFELHYQKNLPDAFQEELQTPKCRTIFGNGCSKTQHPLFRDDFSIELPFVSERWGFKCFVMIPLLSNSRRIGCLHLFGKKKRTFTLEEKKTFLTIGREMATGIAKMQTEEALRQSEKKLRSLSYQLLTAQERERRRISRGLHDELGQALMVLKMQLKQVEKQLHRDQEKLKNDCESSVQYVDEIIENVRRLSWDLSPSILEDLGLLAALRWLFDDFSKRYNVQCLVEMRPFEEPSSKEMNIAIYRIFQESLTNIAKHAHATAVSILVEERDGFFFSSVEDNGQGFNLLRHYQKRAMEKGMGLSAMSERAGMLGGALNIRSEEGKGTRITFTIPIDRKGEK